MYYVVLHTFESKWEIEVPRRDYAIRKAMYLSKKANVTLAEVFDEKPGPDDYNNPESKAFVMSVSMIIKGGSVWVH